MAQLNGTDFKLRLDNIRLTKSRGSSISLTQELPDATTKDDGGFKRHILGLRTGEISVFALSTEDETINFHVLAGYMILRQAVSFSFQSENYEITGDAIIQDVVEVAENEQVTTYDLTLKIKNAILQEIIDPGFLLLETGDYLLLETGDKLILNF